MQTFQPSKLRLQLSSLFLQRFVRLLESVVSSDDDGCIVVVVRNGRIRRLQLRPDQARCPRVSPRRLGRRRSRRSHHPGQVGLGRRREPAHVLHRAPVSGFETYGGATSGIQDSMDQVTEAVSALIEGRPTRKGVRPLSGIRGAYLLLSGDYEMTGAFCGDRIYLANVTSTTLVT